MSKPTRIKCKLPLGKILPLALLLCVCTDTILYTLYYSGSESIQCADIISISPIDKRNTRPIWLPSHPTTLDENLHSEMITILTGKTQGAKQLEHNRRCYPYGVTVTCSIKLSNMNSPDTFSDKFFNQYIMAIRNPITLFPAHLNDKGIKFHGLVGQLSEDNWLKARDEHFHSFIEDWSKVITVWKSMSYTKGMYLVTEELMEMQEGVEALQRFSNLLKEAGHNVVSDEDLICVWKKMIGQEKSEKHRRYKGHDYGGYVPRYTKAQQVYTLKKISFLMNQFHQDKELIQILRRYSKEIEENISLELV